MKRLDEKQRLRLAFRSKAGPTAEPVDAGVTIGHERVTLSGALDLIDNPIATREMLGVFETILSNPRAAKKTVFVDMSAVEDIDACALLYMVAQCDRIGALPGVTVRGNFPENKRARQALVDANFHQYMTTRFKMKRSVPEERTVIISKGRSVDRLNPTAWIQLYNFLAESISETDAESLYHAFGECVENVRQHAYTPKRRGKWFALALKPAQDKPGRAVILDLGVGIARSVRSRHVDHMFAQIAEIVRNSGDALRLWANIQKGPPGDEEADLKNIAGALSASIVNNDWFCAYFASMGLRKHFNESKRGTGLSYLRQAVLDAEAARLHIATGTASVQWSRAQAPSQNVLPRLRGTLVCLELPCKGG